MAKSIETIQLLPDESDIFEKIDFDSKINDDPQLRYKNNSQLIPDLMDRLLNRNAIPMSRLKYFTDPDYESGGRTSAQAIFIKNGNKTREEIFKHPHFLKYLKYFIFGPDLPSEAVEKFCIEVKEMGQVNGTDAFELGVLGRNLSETFSIPYQKAPEEFYKLALECGIDLMWAKIVRDRMRTLKQRKVK